MIDKRFGRLIVVDSFHDGKPSKNKRWSCQCDCGSLHVATTAHLLCGDVQSCGCLRRENRYKHGQVGSPTYYSWAMMLQRCRNPKNPNYKHYGARGIVVCEPWVNFSRFFKDVGARPAGHCLERIDNDGHYELNNVRWATQKEQMNNTRACRLLTIDGVTKNLTQWLQIGGISRATFYKRIEAGWDEIRAATQTTRSCSPRGTRAPRKQRKSRSKNNE